MHCYKKFWCLLAVIITFANADYLGPFHEFWTVTDASENGKFIGFARVPVTRSTRKGWKVFFKFDREVKNIEVFDAVLSKVSKDEKGCEVTNLPEDAKIPAGSKIIFRISGRTKDRSFPKAEIKFRGVTLTGETAPLNLPQDRVGVTNEPETTTTTTTEEPTTLVLPAGALNYKRAISLSLKFFEAQRSGWVEGTTDLKWKRDSGLYDGGKEGVDLTGGYYLRGGYVKFNYPTAFSITQLAWGGIEYWDAYEAAGELDNLLKAIKWGTDYLMKCHAEREEFYTAVGQPSIDHSYWESSSNMNWERPASKVTPETPGSDVAAEASAAMSAAAILFKGVAPEYAQKLEKHARDLFSFADKYRGIYPGSDYASTDYMDELVWAALWQYKHTKKPKPLKYAIENYPLIKNVFNNTYNGLSYDDKTLGVQILLAELAPEEYNMDSVYKYCDLPGGPYAYKVSNGLLTRPGEICPVHLAANAAFVCGIASQRAAGTERSVTYREFVIEQIDRILGGDNTYSYMIGFGLNYPKLVHHRDSSCPLPPNDCGWYFFHSLEENSFQLDGGIVGGPSDDGLFVDNRENWAHNQPNILFNSAFQSALAFLFADRKKLNVGNGIEVNDTDIAKFAAYAPTSLVEYFSQVDDKIYDGCLSNPCQNNGECTTIAPRRVFCKCPFNTFGEVCENKFEPEIQIVSKWGSGAQLQIYFPVSMNVKRHRMHITWPSDCTLKSLKVWDTCIIALESSLLDKSVVFEQIDWLVDKPFFGINVFYSTLTEEECLSTDGYKFRLSFIPETGDEEYEKYTPGTCPLDIPYVRPEDVITSTEAPKPPVVAGTIPPANVETFPPTETSTTPMIDEEPLVEWVNTWGTGGQAHVNINNLKPVNITWSMVLEFPTKCPVDTVQFWNSCGLPDLTDIFSNRFALEQIGWHMDTEYVGLTVEFDPSEVSDACFDSNLYSVTFSEVDAETNANPDACPNRFEIDI